jgi:hypothetical protein
MKMQLIRKGTCAWKNMSTSKRIEEERKNVIEEIELETGNGKIKKILALSEEYQKL